MYEKKDVSPVKATDLLVFGQISYMSIPTNFAVLPLPHISSLEQYINNPSYMYLLTSM